MTQQFKFGDRVKHPKYGECMVVTQWYDMDTDEPTWVGIISEEHGEIDARHEELELIPHPDTIRLDFIINNTSAFQKRQIVNNRYQKPMPNSFRQAIDNAMQAEQSKKV